MVSDRKNTEQNCEIKTYGSPPIDLQSKQLYEQVYGKKTIELAHILRCTEHEISKDSVPPYILFQLIKSFFAAIKSTDPLAFHQDLARRVLEKEFKTKKVPSASIDLLAREICNTLNKMEDKLFPISWLQKTEESIDQVARQKGCGDSVLNIIEIDSPNADKECFNEKNIFKPLSVYLNSLESTGIAGKEQAQKIKEIDVGTESDFWFKTQQREEGEHFFHSAAFMGIARILWEDKVKERITFDKTYPPSLCKPTNKNIISLFNATKETSSNSDAVHLVKGTNIIGKVEIPTIPRLLIQRVINGIGKINTVVGHKALRYAVSLPFKQKLNGVRDFRVKEFEGGFVELGKEMGLVQKKNLNELREILYALKYLELQNVKESRITQGKLIDVTHFISPNTGRDDGLILTVLPTLVAYGEVDCKGTLLIPMATQSPPVKGIVSKPLYASLYHLQMILMEEFSEKSIELNQYKCIKISDEDWDRMLLKANINRKYKDPIKKG